jgi:hypothetical protein
MAGCRDTSAALRWQTEMNVMGNASGGRGRARTGGLLVANEALSQLSYTPIVTNLHETKRFLYAVATCRIPETVIVTAVAALFAVVCAGFGAKPASDPRKCKWAAA